jgi:hypothetical protein
MVEISTKFAIEVFPDASFNHLPIVVKFRHFVATQDNPVQQDNMSPLGTSHALYSETQVDWGICTSWLLTQLFELCHLRFFLVS